jgi:hypothetical protein
VDELKADVLAEERAETSTKETNAGEQQCLVSLYTNDFAR